MLDRKGDRIMVKKAWQYSGLDKSVTIRFKKIGNLGEYLAGKFLKESGFKNIKDLNKEESANTKDFDFIAERNKIKYAISVKTRNKYENSAAGLKLNSRYKLTKDPVNFAKDAKKKYNSEAAWIVISLEIDKGVFNAYFGVLSDLNGNHKGINMSQEATRKYEKLALLRKFEDMGLTKSDYEGLKNEYKRA